jgi:hypothetical protein
VNARFEARVRREQRIGTALCDASEDLERRDFDRAHDCVNEAIRASAPDARLTALKEGIVAERARWHRAEMS